MAAVVNSTSLDSYPKSSQLRDLEYIEQQARQRQPLDEAVTGRLLSAGVLQVLRESTQGDQVLGVTRYGQLLKLGIA